jgi:hypothetical protein
MPQLGDPDYDITAFGREVFGGGLRWLATVLAAVAALFVIAIFAELLPPDMSWPIRARGTAATLIAVGALVLWSVIAVVNWRSHANESARRRAFGRPGDKGA